MDGPHLLSPTRGPHLVSPTRGVRFMVRLLVHGERLENASGFLLLLMLTVVVGTFGTYLDGAMYWLTLAIICIEGGLKILRFWVSMFDGVKCLRILSLWEAYTGMHCAMVVRAFASASQILVFGLFLRFTFLLHRRDHSLFEDDDPSSRWVPRLFETLMVCSGIFLIHFSLGILVLGGTVALWLITGQDRKSHRRQGKRPEESLLGSRNCSRRLEAGAASPLHRFGGREFSYGWVSRMRELGVSVVAAFRDRWNVDSQRGALTLYVHERRHFMLTGLAALESDACGLPTKFTARWEDLWVELRRGLDDHKGMGPAEVAVVDGILDMLKESQPITIEDWGTLEESYLLAPRRSGIQKNVARLMADALPLVIDPHDWKDSLTVLPETLNIARFAELTGLGVLEPDGTLRALALASLPRLKEVCLGAVSGCHLAIVKLHGCPELESVSAKSLSALKSLHVSECPRLRRLGVAACGSMTDVKLRQCPAIEELTLVNCEVLADVRAEASLKGLRSLTFHGCRALPYIPPWVEDLLVLRLLELLDLQGCELLSEKDLKSSLRKAHCKLEVRLPEHLKQSPAEAGVKNSNAALANKSRVQDTFIKGVTRRMQSWTKYINPNSLRIEEALPYDDVKYKWLCEATDNWSTLIGHGGVSQVYKTEVYKALLPDNKECVVKKQDLTWCPDVDRYVSMVKTFGTTVKHSSVLELLGATAEPSVLYLIYPYMPNGRLKDVLFSHWHVPWCALACALKDMAKVLDYLHNKCPRIIHGDVTPDNIWLDFNLKAKLGNFDIAKDFVEDDAEAPDRGDATEFASTFSYKDPVCFYSEVTTAADLYSLGMTIMVSVSRSDPFTEKCAGDIQHHLRHLFKQGNPLEFAHRDFQTANQGEVIRFLKAALWCVDSRSYKRPDAGKLYSMLAGRSRIPDITVNEHPDIQQLEESEDFPSRLDSGR